MNDTAKYTLGMQFVAVAVLTLVLVGSIYGALFGDDEPASTGVQGATSIQVSPTPDNSSLQVRDAVGEPAPLNSPIQGAQGTTQQDASSPLQQPSASDDLQPNARLSDFPENL